MKTFVTVLPPVSVAATASRARVGALIVVTYCEVPGATSNTTTSFSSTTTRVKADTSVTEIPMVRSFVLLLPVTGVNCTVGGVASTTIVIEVCVTFPLGSTPCVVTVCELSPTQTFSNGGGGGSQPTSTAEAIVMSVAMSPATSPIVKIF